MIEIFKASAGSGKTYNLALQYIRLILTSDRPDAYRHVLAVTFTNKATDEMKRRILKELHTLAKDPGKSPYIDRLVPSCFPSADQLQERAQRQLTGILHDYSSFAVSTIDKFFQQTLRAFSHEIGQFSSYQVQLDRESLVTESVDRLLDSLEEGGSPLVEWLTEGVKKDLDRTGHYHLEDRLKALATGFDEIQESGMSLSMDRLRQTDECCDKVIKAFPPRVEQAAENILACLAAHGLEPESTNRGWLAKVRNYIGLDASEAVLKPTPAFIRSASDSSKWFSKANDRMRLEMEGSLEGPLQDFLNLWGLPYKEYRTALIIRSQIYSLGVAERLRNEFASIQKEKNIISIDDSNTILKSIIDGTDAPFIYEKLGVRFDSFLLDEFQDTSDVQWENFKPLLSDSAGSGSMSMVVGDVKQSIYRWRGSDWRLLGWKLREQFRPDQTHVTPLQQNFRTCREIVEFNNAFFEYAAGVLDSVLGLSGADSISSLYSDVVQEACFRDPAPGSVEICFPESQIDEIISTIEELMERGAHLGDIAILVRGNKEGSRIAQALVGKGIRVVSDDSLFVKSSVTVRRLISELSQVESYSSLTELAEGLLRKLRDEDPAHFESEVPYIMSFMDFLQDWIRSGGNSLSAFLSAWKDANPMIASPSSGDAVRVMTIHKSKGLEFPFVIFPYTEKVTLYKGSPLWCRPSLDGSALEGNAEGVYNVSLDSSADDTLFTGRYQEEVKMQAVDAINVFYVALTRAKYGLKLISAQPPANPGEIRNFGRILHDYTVQTGKNFFGEAYDFHNLKREKEQAEAVSSGYPSFPADSGKRLRFSPEAADYFGPDGSYGIQASNRIRGNVLHSILSSVVVPSDIEKAVRSAVDEGLLPEADSESARQLLEKSVAEVESRGWFSPEAKIIAEADIFDAYGRDYRPDRVVISPDSQVSVVDYKFGREDEKYRRQVAGYMSLYKAMGYRQVKGYIWYFAQSKVVEVS